ncbi:hypothetical protein TcWFU_004918 [Taenia crassiceps]|uniref:Uncharacterized protein n=1 Tax=Taenia crassiceps TaxID=6207 RepID=A0ABR4QAR6_9CEST
MTHHADAAVKAMRATPTTTTKVPSNGKHVDQIQRRDEEGVVTRTPFTSPSPYSIPSGMRQATLLFVEDAEARAGVGHVLMHRLPLSFSMCSTQMALLTTTLCKGLNHRRHVMSEEAVVQPD